MELVSLSRLAGSPDRYTQENEILDEKLPGIPQHEKTMWKLERSRCREKKTHREHEGDNGPNAADEREPRGKRPQSDKQGNDDLDHSDQFETA